MLLSGVARAQGVINVPRNKIWRLQIPNKMKVFVWRFCKNNIPVRKRLSAKGVRLPITCPMCGKNLTICFMYF